VKKKQEEKQANARLVFAQPRRDGESGNETTTIEKTFSSYKEILPYSDVVALGGG
jgi:hypothetical protein